MNKFLFENIRCPDCYSRLTSEMNLIKCLKCHMEYLIVSKKLILVSKDNELFPVENYINASKNKNNYLLSKIKSAVPEISVNLSQKKMLYKFKKIIEKRKNYKLLVLGCGNQRKDLLSIFDSDKNIIFTDISLESDCDIIIDCHNIPFEDKSFDGIIITAVLEHVYDPEDVVKSIHRVLKDHGIVYSEIPFMQQIHEGAYDFTRYSMVGHNKLFHHFKLIDYGLVAGPGSVLAWSIENFIKAFFNKNILRNFSILVSRILFFWLKYFDYFFQINKKSLDGASCTYVLAEKINRISSKKEIINTYNN